MKINTTVIVMDPFEKIKPNVEFTIVWMFVSPKNVIICSKSWVRIECVIFYSVRLCHIYRWVSVSLLQFFKINTYACTWVLFVLSTTPMTWHALSCIKSECVVKSYNVLSRFMLTHMHFTMYCQLKQRFIIHAYFIWVAPINFFLNARIK